MFLGYSFGLPVLAADVGSLKEEIVEGKSFPWTRGDMLVVPSWLTHYHRASSDAVLFRVTDTPTLEKLGFLRDECPAV